MVLLSFFFCLLVVGGVASPQGPGRPGHGQPGHDQPGGHGRPGHGGGPGGSGAGAASISPAYDWIFEYPLPIPPVAQPKYSEKVKGANIRYYELTIESFEKQVYPNLGPAHFTGYSEYHLSTHVVLSVSLTFALQMVPRQGQHSTQCAARRPW